MYQKYMQLDEAAKQAKMAGMSYGQWVAQYRQNEKPYVRPKSEVLLRIETEELEDEKAGQMRDKVAYYFRQGHPLSLIADKLGISLDKVRELCAPRIAN